ERLDDDVLDEIFERDPAVVGVWALADDGELDARLTARGFERGWWPHWMAADTRALAHDADERVMLADEVPEYDDYGTALLSLTRGRPRRFWHAVARVDGAYAGHAWAHRA